MAYFRERASCPVIGYPSKQDGAILPARGTRCATQENSFLFPYNKTFIGQACSVKMTGYWPRFFFACLWTSTPSRSINTHKKNLANIQPSWPHAWSITHIFYRVFSQAYYFMYSLGVCYNLLPILSKWRRVSQVFFMRSDKINKLLPNKYILFLCDQSTQRPEFIRTV